MAKKPVTSTPPLGPKSTDMPTSGNAIAPAMAPVGVPVSLEPDEEYDRRLAAEHPNTNPEGFPDTLQSDPLPTGEGFTGEDSNTAAYQPVGRPPEEHPMAGQYNPADGTAPEALQGTPKSDLYRLETPTLDDIIAKYPGVKPLYIHPNNAYSDYYSKDKNVQAMIRDLHLAGFQPTVVVDERSGTKAYRVFRKTRGDAQSI